MNDSHEKEINVWSCSLLIVQCIWQYHSKSYDNHDAYSSVNGAAICTTQVLPDPLPVGLCCVLGTQ